MAGPARVVTRRRSRNAARRFVAERGFRRHADTVLYVGLMLGTAITGFSIWRWPHAVPPLAVAPFILLAGLLLRIQRLNHVFALNGLVLTLDAYTQHRPLVVIAAFALLGIMYVVATSRARLGIRGLTGENLLVDLRDRLERTAEIPPLPSGWSAEFAIAAANGEGFAGDFLVTSLPINSSHLEVALVDVSGKGRQAGSRSLHLSGAFSGLLGSVPPETFLTRANDYLLRQRWDEGFATAVHLWLDLDTGRYAVSRAGHPPAAVFRSGTASWLLDSTVPGPLLGVFGGAEFPLAHGELAPGDGLLMYSDGVVESRGRDLIDGLDRMLGVASGILVAGRMGVADGVVAGARSGESDDRAAFFIRRV
ncbi:MAG: serine/threonine-protein phosphatase [Actinobacteria bacterium]|uniref:Putative integral membrane protein n=1 Tax=Phycicoccus elongatus Lp2 TaxID=1193181 RepID=N0E6F8_9MICO|nr:PP2C family protein-serine/threonine phosphatase [Phycicoccus elongatus]MCA0322854.1 serine/threonine-protein phosphatase [Actinomycetota bacterium]CCH71469.1 putative integral membrane protein [Phycicoccus elongatus Lp2]